MSTKTAPARSGSWRKHLLWIVPAALAVLLVSGWFGVTFAVENTARRCLADASLRLIGQEVEPEKVSCSLIGQELCIEGLCVDNPPGYSQERPAVEVDLIRVRVNPPAFLFEGVVHLKKLTVSGVRINVEMKRSPVTLEGWLEQLSNPEVSLLELKRNGPVSERNAVKREKRSGPRRTKTPLKFRIDELRVENAAAILHNYTLISEARRTLTLKNYVQKDLGRDAPLTADELAREIFNRHWNDIKKYLKDKKDEGVARVKKLFGKKTKKEKTAETPAPPAQPEDEAAKKKKSAARRQLLKGAGRAAVDLAEIWLKKKQKQMEEAPVASGDPEEDRKARRNKRLVDLGVRAADAVREELAEPPAAPEKRSE
ncbi:MAG: hypothetical protein IJT50_00485 [Lentisphaeria bacterium]|nr:hypothetical protein [Lentisphaeria bacterium]